MPEQVWRSDYGPRDETPTTTAQPMRSDRLPTVGPDPCRRHLMARYSRAASFLMCRTLGHSWDPIPAESVGKYGGDPLWLRCQRCDTVRQDSISRSTGDLMTRRYVYEENYRHAFDDTFDVTPTRGDFRRMLLQQAIIKQRNARALAAAQNEHPSTTTPAQKRNGAA